jgi:hypothetical protein
MPVYHFVCETHGEFAEITIRAEWDRIRCPKCGLKPEISGDMKMVRKRGPREKMRRTAA